MTELEVIFSPRFLEYDFAPDHPFSEKSREFAVKLMESYHIFNESAVWKKEIRSATDAEIALFHSQTYINFLKNMCSKQKTGYLDTSDTPVFKNCYEVSSYIVGGSLTAIRDIMDGKMDHSFNVAGGLHHAHPDFASGFCVLNDVGVIMKYYLDLYPTNRIAYIDIDAHHGDGVFYGFYNDARVLDIDFHEDGRFLFPGTGTIQETGPGTKLNVPLLPGWGDSAFLYLFEKLVPDRIESFNPDLIIVQTGVDGHSSDPLAHLKLTAKSYLKVIDLVHSLSHKQCGGKMILLGGGGYNPLNISRIWTIITAKLLDITLPNSIPDSWRSEFAQYYDLNVVDLYESEYEDNKNEIEEADKLYQKIKKAMEDLEN